MQRKSRHTAVFLVASSVLGGAACASEVIPSVGEPSASGSGGSGTLGTSGQTAAGSGGVGGAGAGAGAGAGGTTNGQAGAGGSASGTSSGGAGGEPPVGGNGGSGGTGGAAGTGGAGGKAGAGGVGGAGGGAGRGGAGGGGTAGAGGASGGAGAGGEGGSGGGPLNLIQNFGFETNTSGWSVFGGGATISTATAQSHSGARSLLITGRTQAYQGPQYSVLSVVMPGTSYTLSLWGRLSSTTPAGSLTVTVHYTCDGGSSDGDNYFRWVEPAVASATSWTQLTAVQTFPACGGGGTMTAASLYVESPTATLAYYIDDVVLTTP